MPPKPTPTQPLPPETLTAVAHQTQVIEGLRAQRQLLAPAQSTALNKALAQAHSRRGVALCNLGEPQAYFNDLRNDTLDSAIADHTQAIELLEELLRALASWEPGTLSLRSQLAESYFARCAARCRNGQLHDALADLTHGIDLSEQLRKDLEPIGQWTLILRQTLVRAYRERGDAFESRGELAAAIVQHSRAIELMEAARSELEPGEERAAHWEHDLADLYSIRGLAHRSNGDFAEAVADHTLGLDLLERAGEPSELSSELAVAWEGRSAEAFLNRASARFALRKVPEAIADCTQGIELLEAQRARLESGEWWSKQHSDLAGAYKNRSLMLKRLRREDEAFADLEQVIQLGEELRVRMGPGDQWTPAMRNALTAAYRSRAAARFKRGEFAAASEDYGQAIELGEVLRRRRGPAGRNLRELAGLAEAYSNRAAARDSLGDLEGSAADRAIAEELRGVWNEVRFG